MIRKIPKPVSGGLILSYRCPAQCRHCMYACSPRWNADWISTEGLESILSQLVGKIAPAPYGPEATALNYGLHFTGGEPFANFDCLCRAVAIAERLKIPSTFVETNCYWCRDDRTTAERLETLKSKGLKGILISVNPFYLEYIPFERTERAIRLSLEIYGRNTMIYQFDYYLRFRDWGFQGRIALDNYLEFESSDEFTANAEFFVMGRAPYSLKDLLRTSYPARKAEAFFGQPCLMPFLRPLHNHFDNYGNYVPGFCAGISLGEVRELERLLRDGIDTERYPVLGFLIDEDIRALFEFAGNLGYEEAREGYLSKCHLCMDVRRYLALSGSFDELTPREFYTHLAD